MTSWKTTLGGALAALGTFLWGAPVALKAMEVPVEPALVKWCVIAGLIASAAGVFFIGLFGRDNNVTSEDVQRAQQEKEQKRMDSKWDMPSVWIIAFAVLSLGLAGCMTVHKATVTLTAVVDAGMKDWAQASAQGRTTPELDAKVIAAHNEYRKVCGGIVPIYEAASAKGENPDAAAVLGTLRAAVDPLMDLILPVLLPAEQANLNTQLRKVNAP